MYQFAPGTQCKNSCLKNAQTVHEGDSFATMKAHAGGAEPAGLSLGWRSWQTSICLFPSNKLMLLGTVFHSLPWTSTTEHTHSGGPSKTTGWEICPHVLPGYLLSQHKCAVSVSLPQFHRSQLVPSLHRCLWNTWSWWPHPQAIERELLCKMPPP